MKTLTGIVLKKKHVFLTIGLILFAGISFAETQNESLEMRETTSTGALSQGTGVVEGRVLIKETQLPVPGAVVKLVSGDNQTNNLVQFESMTDRNGSFRFSALPEHAYFVFAEKEGLAPFYAEEQILRELHNRNSPVDPLRQSADTVFLKEGGQNRVDLFLTQPRTVRGQVLNAETGEPLAQADVGIMKIWNEDTRTGVGMTQTDAEGRFEFTQLPASKTVAAAKKEGYYGYHWTEGLLFYNLMSRQKQFENTLALDLTQDSAPKDIVLKLLPGGTIEGFVKNTENQPVSGAKVGIHILGSETHSLEDGSYRLTGLPRRGGDGYQVTASATGYASTMVDKISIPSIEPVRADIMLKHEGWIVGTVYGRDGKPVAGAKIHHDWQYTMEQIQKEMNSEYKFMNVRFSSDFEPRDAISDEDGNYELRSMHAGKYAIHAVAGGYQPFVGIDVYTEYGKETRLDIQLTPIEPIAGRVASATGAPLAGVNLNLSVEPVPDNNPISYDPIAYLKYKIGYDFWDGEIKSATDGTFRFDVLYPLTYKVTARYRDKGRAEQMKELTGLYPGDTNIEIRFDELKIHPDVKGRVVDAATGMPISQFRIGVHNPENIQKRKRDDRTRDLFYGTGRTVTDASGEFILQNLPYAPVELFFSAPGYAAQLAGPFDLDPATDEVFVSLAREGQILARVENRESWKGDTQVYISPTRDTNFEEWRNSRSPKNADSYGISPSVAGDRVIIRNLPTGVYDVRVSCTNAIASATCVQVTEGEITDVGALPSFFWGDDSYSTLYNVAIQKSDGSPYLLTKIRIRMFSWFDHWGEYQTDTQGRFSPSIPTLPIPWDRAFVQVGEDPMRVSEWIPHSGGNVIVSDDSPGNSSIHGVVMQNNQPVEKFPVTLVFTDKSLKNRPVYQTKTDGMGRYVIKNIPAGLYLLLIGGQNSGELIGRDDSNRTDREIRMEEIPLAELEDRFVQTELEGSSLMGMVVNQNGEPMSGAYVQIEFALELSERQRNLLFYRPACIVQANAYGLFTFTNLQPGEYEIRASRYTHGVSQIQRIIVGEKNVEGVKIQLKQGILKSGVPSPPRRRPEY